MAEEAFQTRIKVLCNFTKNPARLQLLREQIEQALGALLSQIDLVLNPQDWQKALPQAEVVGAFALSPEEFARCQKLRWLHLGLAGVEKSLHTALLNSDVVVTNARGIHGDMMGQYILAAILMCAHRFDLAAAGRVSREWRQKEIVLQRQSIVGKVVGIIGTGAIGTAAALLCRTCGLRVIGLRRSPEKGVPDGFDAVWGPEGLDALLAAADYVVLAAPLTAQTQRLLDASHLAMMKTDAFLINVARGALVDEQALIEALQQRRIAGAVLDVFLQEPLPRESSLWRMDNVFITPHVAGNFEQYIARVGAQFAENLAGFLCGETLRNVVDKKRGY